MLCLVIYNYYFISYYYNIKCIRVNVASQPIKNVHLSLHSELGEKVVYNLDQFIIVDNKTKKIAKSI